MIHDFLARIRNFFPLLSSVDSTSSDTYVILVELEYLYRAIEISLSSLVV